MSEITQSTILAEIAAAIAAANTHSDAGPQAATMREIAEAMGIADKTARRRIEKLILGGQVVTVSVQRKSVLTGNMYTTYGYKLAD